MFHELYTGNVCQCRWPPSATSYCTTLRLLCKISKANTHVYVSSFFKINFMHSDTFLLNPYNVYKYMMMVVPYESMNGCKKDLEYP